MQTSSLADRILSALELRVGQPPCPYTPTRPLLCWSCPVALQSESRLAGSLYHPHPLLPAENPAEPLAAFHGVPEEGEAKRPAGDFAREPGIKLFDCWEAPSPSSPDPEISQQEGRLSWSLRRGRLWGEAGELHKGSFCCGAQGRGLQLRKHLQWFSLQAPAFLSN